ARTNGVPELELIGAKQVASLEPSIAAAGAIYSGSTGVIDQMELMRSLLNATEERGALVAFKHTITSLERDADAFVARFIDPAGEPGELRA
ncbi:MAG: FAD-dependent oxidoreductase, partial [Dehalococcoidia bacterium]